MREVQLASVLSRAGGDWGRRRGAAHGALLRLLARGGLLLHPAGEQLPRSVSKFVERVGTRRGFYVVAADGGGRGGTAVAGGGRAAVAARPRIRTPGREAGQHPDHAAARHW